MTTLREAVLAKFSASEIREAREAYDGAVMGLLNHAARAKSLLDDCDGDEVIASRLLLELMTQSKTWSHEYCRGVVALALTEMARRGVV